uniref:Uncharacterized protein n=1 Tax=Fagus sylvatica TaxID=28930 RepID=A0A2N9EUZ6_FAGSY
MAANEAEWSLPLSEELPEGLSDESAGEMTRGGSSEADDIDRMRRRYQIPDDVVLKESLTPDERACCPKYEGDVAFYEADLRAGLAFSHTAFCEGAARFFRFGAGASEPKRLADDHLMHGYVEESGCQYQGSSKGYLRPIGFGRTRYFFVCGDNWERLPQEDPRDFRPESVGRWGIPSSPGLLDRPCTELRLAAEDFKDIGYRRSSVAVEPLVLKRKRAGEGSSKQAEEPPTRPPPTQAVPLVQDPPPVIMGLNEAMVMSERCIAAEEGLATLRAKSQRRPRCPSLGLLRPFEDINTRYFLSGFEAFRKQAVQRFPGLDFSALQPYDDEGLRGWMFLKDQAGDDDVSSK